MKRIITLPFLAGVILLASDMALAQTIHPQWSAANDSIILYSRVGTAADLLVLNPHTGEFSA